MRSTSRGSNKKYPDKYDDPLGMDEITPGGTHLPAAAPVVVTGLSDEEDAARFMAREFNPDLMFCPNCEGHYDTADMEYKWCRYCGDNLRPMGTPARKRKFDQR